MACYPARLSVSDVFRYQARFRANRQLQVGDMAKSLQDQLLKAGLVDKDKAQKTRKQQQKKKKQQTKTGASDTDAAKLKAQQAIAEQKERDRKLNQQRQLEAEKKAIAAQIRQLIENNTLPRDGGEVAYKFNYQNKIKTIYVHEKHQKDLVAGRIAIVALGELFHLVPAPVADKIAQRDPDLVVKAKESSPAEAGSDDEYYAQFEIPDDLMW